jgi:hypothetical protein
VPLADGGAPGDSVAVAVCEGTGVGAGVPPGVVDALAPKERLLDGVGGADGGSEADAVVGAALALLDGVVPALSELGGVADDDAVLVSDAGGCVPVAVACAVDDDDGDSAAVALADADQLALTVAVAAADTLVDTVAAALADADAPGVSDGVAAGVADAVGAGVPVRVPVPLAVCVPVPLVVGVVVGDGHAPGPGICANI